MPTRARARPGGQCADSEAHFQALLAGLDSRDVSSNAASNNHQVLLLCDRVSTAPGGSLTQRGWRGRTRGGDKATTPSCQGRRGNDCGKTAQRQQASEPGQQYRAPGSTDDDCFQQAGRMTFQGIERLASILKYRVSDKVTRRRLLGSRSGRPEGDASRSEDERVRKAQEECGFGR